MKTYNGVAYFEHFTEARDFGATTHGYPAHRVIRTERGWAVECRPGGDCFGASGQPVPEVEWPDLVVENHGSAWIFEARSDRGLRFLRDDCVSESWQWTDPKRLCVDWRPARDLMQHAEAAGLTVETE